MEPDLKLILEASNEVANLRLKTNVIDKEEYTRRINTLGGIIKQLHENWTKTAAALEDSRAQVRELTALLKQSKLKK